MTYSDVTTILQIACAVLFMMYLGGEFWGRWVSSAKVPIPKRTDDFDDDLPMPNASPYRTKADCPVWETVFVRVDGIDLAIGRIRRDGDGAVMAVEWDRGVRTPRQPPFNRTA